MPAGDQITVRRLPQGGECKATVRSLEGRLAELEIDVSEDFPLEQAVELSSQTVVYLGVVKQTEKLPTGMGLLWLSLEHRLERASLAEMQSSWEDGWKIAEKIPEG